MHCWRCCSAVAAGTRHRSHRHPLGTCCSVRRSAGGYIDSGGCRRTRFGPAAAAPPTKDALLTFTVDKLGAPTIDATVGSEEEKAKLLAALTAKFGADHLNATITVDPETKPAGWLDKLDGLLPLMQLPGAEAKLSGEKIELSGTAADARNGWMDKLKSLFGAGFTIGTFNVKQAVESAKESFMSAFSSLSDDCAPADVAKVLNLQVINFRKGPTCRRKTCNCAGKSAQVLMACAARARP